MKEHTHMERPLWRQKHSRVTLPATTRFPVSSAQVPPPCDERRAPDNPSRGWHHSEGENHPIPASAVSVPLVSASSASMASEEIHSTHVCTAQRTTCCKRESTIETPSTY